MKTTLTALSIVAAALAAASPALAHHGNAAYDGTVTILKDATVTKLSWANPHTILEFDVKGENGQPVHWAAELGSPSALGLIGWTKTSVSPGDMITVYVHQAKTKNPVGRIDHIVLADGSSLRDSSGGGGNNDVDNPGRGGRGGRRGGGAGASPY